MADIKSMTLEELLAVPYDSCTYGERDEVEE